jgi:hypothetical protein
MRCQFTRHRHTGASSGSRGASAWQGSWLSKVGQRRLLNAKLSCVLMAAYARQS